MKDVGAGASVGCGMFGLLGLLISVGIVAFLGAKTMGTFDSGGGSKTTTTVPVSLLHLSKLGTLADGDEVRVTSTKLPANAGVVISTCLNIEHDPIADGLDEPRCDANTNVLASTDETGHLKASYKIRRHIEIDSRPLDCSIQIGECTIRAVSVGGTPQSVDTPLTIKGG